MGNSTRGFPYLFDFQCDLSRQSEREIGLYEVARILRSTLSQDEVRVLLSVYSGGVSEKAKRDEREALNSLISLRLVAMDGGRLSTTELGLLVVISGDN